MLEGGATVQQGITAGKLCDNMVDFGTIMVSPLVWMSHLNQRREAVWARSGRWENVLYVWKTCLV